MPLVPAAIMAGAAITQAIIKSKGAKSAAKTQAAASEAVSGSIDKATGQAIDAGYAGMTQANTALNDNTGRANGVLSDVYKNLNGTLDPYLAAGKQGVTQLSEAMAPGGSLSKQFSFGQKDMEADPGYQFQLQEGMKAIQNAAAARGGLGAGGTFKALSNYNQGLAGTSFQNAYNRAAGTFQMNRTNTLNGLNMLTNVGQNAVNQSINVGENYSNNTSANYNRLGAGLADVAMNGNQFVGKIGLQGAEDSGKVRLGGADATAAGQVASTNAWSQGVGGVAQAAGSAYAALSNGSNAPAPVSLSTLQNLPVQTPSAASRVPLIPAYDRGYTPARWGSV